MGAQYPGFRIIVRQSNTAQEGSQLMVEQRLSLEQMRRFIECMLSPFAEQLEVQAEVTHYSPCMQTTIDQHQHYSPMHIESRSFHEEVEQAEAAIVRHRDIAFEQPWGTYAYQRACRKVGVHAPEYQSQDTSDDEESEYTMGMGDTSDATDSDMSE